MSNSLGAQVRLLAQDPMPVLRHGPVARARLALEVDDTLIWLLAIRAGGEAVAGPATYSKQGKKLERRLVKILLDGWDGAAEDAVATAVASIAGRAGVVTEDEVREALDAVAERMGPSFAAEVIPRVRETLEDSYRLGRSLFGRGEDGQMPEAVKFGLADERVVGWLERDSNYWIGSTYNRRLGEEIAAGAATTIIEGGLGRKAAGKELEKILAGSLLDESIAGRQGYFEGLAAVAATRARSFGAVEGMVEAGVNRLEIVAVMDEKTSPICREMNGRIIEVAAAVQVRDAIVGATNPEEVKAVAPWISAAAAKTQSSADLAQGGVCLPPFHLHCRTTTVAVFDETDDGVSMDFPDNATPETRQAFATLTPKELQNKLALAIADPDRLVFDGDGLSAGLQRHGFSRAEFDEPPDGPAMYRAEALRALQNASNVYGTAGPKGERVYEFVDRKRGRVLTMHDDGTIESYTGTAGLSGREFGTLLRERDATAVAIRNVPGRAEAAAVVADVHAELGGAGRKPLLAKDVVGKTGAELGRLIDDHPALYSQFGRDLLDRMPRPLLEGMELPHEPSLAADVLATEESLPSQQKSAIMKWTRREGSKDMAEAWKHRDEGGKVKNLKEAQHLLDYVQGGDSVRVSNVVFRGMSKPDLRSADGSLVKYEPGKRFTVGYVAASSMDPALAAQYATEDGGVLFVFVTDRGVYISPLGQEKAKTLHEALIPEPTEFEIVDTGMMDIPASGGQKVKRRVIFMKQVTDESAAERQAEREERSDTGYVGFEIDMTDSVEADIASGKWKPLDDDVMDYLRERWG